MLRRSSFWRQFTGAEIGVNDFKKAGNFVPMDGLLEQLAKRMLQPGGNVWLLRSEPQTGKSSFLAYIRHVKNRLGVGDNDSKTHSQTQALLRGKLTVLESPVILFPRLLK